MDLKQSSDAEPLVLGMDINSNAKTDRCPQCGYPTNVVRRERAQALGAKPATAPSELPPQNPGLFWTTGAEYP